MPNEHWNYRYRICSVTFKETVSEGVDIASILRVQNLLSLIVIIAELMEVIGLLGGR